MEPVLGVAPNRLGAGWVWGAPKRDELGADWPKRPVLVLVAGVVVLPKVEPKGELIRVGAVVVLVAPKGLEGCCGVEPKRLVVAGCCCCWPKALLEKGLVVFVAGVGWPKGVAAAVFVLGVPKEKADGCVVWVGWPKGFVVPVEAVLLPNSDVPLPHTLPVFVCGCCGANGLLDVLVVVFPLPNMSRLQFQPFFYVLLGEFIPPGWPCMRSCMLMQHGLIDVFLLMFMCRQIHVFIL